LRQIARVGDTWWYGTTRGISIATSTSSSRGFVNLTHRNDDPTSLPQNYTSSILLDPKGRLVVSTFGGLGVLDPYSPGGPYRFRNIGIAQGLASDKISGVLADDRGNLWVSTSSGVSRIDNGTYAVHNLGTDDGLHIPSYIYAGAARARRRTAVWRPRRPDRLAAAGTHRCSTGDHPRHRQRQRDAV
jgi:hypothetical protein